MSFIKKSTSALGKLIIVVLLAATFLVGLVSVVYLSLQGEEIKVPEIVGKNFAETEKELASLGLRIKKRADRYSEEAPNTILEQLPKSGDTVKTGQMILVVISKANADGTETPMTIKKNNESDDSEKIEELIDDKPKKNSNRANSATNKKRTTTTRDVISNTSTNSNTNPANGKTNNSSSNNSSNSNKTTTPTNKTTPTNTTKPSTGKPNDGGDTRPRKTNP